MRLARIVMHSQVLTIIYLAGCAGVQLRDGWPADRFPTALALIPVCAVIWIVAAIIRARGDIPAES